jgi:uracil-DNA glycosylase family 4
MPFQNVLAGERPKRTFIGETPKKPKLSAKEVGCEFCPLNGIAGIHKVIGTVHGREVFIWGMAPGPDENREGREFIGKSGKLLWQELKRVGISREMCDVQNVVRCYPADRDEDEYPALKMRNPTAEEIHCCSIYTKRAIEKQQAKVHLVFGEIAAKTLLGSEFKKGKKQFWSEKLNGYVLCIWHPSYFVRMGYYAGGTQPPNDKFKQWRADFELAAKLLGRKDRYEFVKSMKYIGVAKRAQAIEMYRRIERAASKDWRVVVDIEDGVLRSGRRAVLMVGFCYSVGTTYVLCLDHRKGVVITDEDRAFNWKIARRILRDASIKKTLHHGSYDAKVQLELMGVEMAGFDYDTEFGEYFSDPEAKAYGLTKITERRFPEFSGYKEIVTPECYTPEFLATIPQNSKMSPSKKYDQARKKNGLNYALVPWPKMVVYNGADCDVTKRIEVSTRERSNPALMHVYIDLSYLTTKMEKDGPLLDYRHHTKVMQLYEVRVPRLERQIKAIADNPKFSPGSPKQVANLLYRQLELEMPESEDAKENTRAETLELMVGQHKVVQLILDYRRAAKLKSTYMDGFKRSADMHNGNVTTKWWITGCLPAGELVLTNRGYLPVEQVCVGDLVISHRGKPRKITDTILNGVKHIIKITLDNGLTLRTTLNHPYRIGNGWIRADDLEEGMQVIVHSDGEEWRDVSGWEDYEVSSWGRVFSRKLHRMLAQFSKGTWGHLQVGLYDNGLSVHFPVHRLVGMVFLEESAKPEIRHLNGIAWDNTVGNLMWGTRVENAQDTKRHGTSAKNEFLTDEIVEFIRSQPYRHGLDTDLARKIGCSRESVRDVRKGRYRLTESQGKRVEFKAAAVEKIEYLPSEMTYGLTVEKDGSHVTMGIVTHNTRTGRMSSGAGREKKEEAEHGMGLVNLQNIVMDVQLQNLLISDERWRDLYQHWKKKGPFTEANWRQFEDLDVFLGFDQGQFEMRVVAQRCGDRNLIGHFERDEDIHAEVGHTLMGIDKEILMEESPERVAVKGMHFGLVYGLKAPGLWAHLRSEYLKRGMKFDKTVAWVQNLLDSYFAKYKKVAEMIEADHRHAEEFGWVETMFHFRQPINVQEQKEAGASWTGAYWANQASNGPIQGTAHQLLSIGLVPIIRQPEKYALLQRPKMEIHDAIYFIVKLKQLWQSALLGQDMLENECINIVRKEFGIDWKVKLKAEPKAGFRFGNLVKNIGIGKGPKTTSEFLNQFCEKAQKAQQALAEELGKLAN